MRAAVGLAWRGAAMFAFGATAALAVTLNRPVPTPASLTAAARPQPTPTCAAAGLAVSLARGAGASGSPYHVDFTNTSGSACTLGGYPQVAAYAVGRHGYAQVGNAALREAAGAASRVLLRPGGTVALGCGHFCGRLGRGVQASPGGRAASRAAGCFHGPVPADPADRVLRDRPGCAGLPARAGDRAGQRQRRRSRPPDHTALSRHRRAGHGRLVA